MALVAIETGMRWGELVGLRVRHFDLPAAPSWSTT
jgi:integrase